VHTQSEKDQSRFVVETLERLRREGIPQERVAVLFRASFHSFDLEIELNREGIPFVKVGGFKFMESAHIKDVLAHLRVLANFRDRMSWTRIFLLLERVGPKSAQAAFEALMAADEGCRGLVEPRHKSLARKEMAGLRELFRRMEDIPSSQPADLGAAVLAYYTPVLERLYDDHPRRLRDLEQLVTIMERYGDLDAFLSDMALEPPTSMVEERLAADADRQARLTLSTVHSAKGLEWDAVFILWSLDGRFPSQYALEREEDVEEERRLMYVAATRAREQLFFLCPAYAYDRSTQMVLNQPSRFIDGLPDSVLEHVYPEGGEGGKDALWSW
jgi:DNA helicase-2/ATP-dependent DNA helicase PcrA